MFFEKTLDKRSKKTVIDFFTVHCRYNTMNSWNRSTSYAQNIKLHNLGLTSEQLNAAYDMLQTDFWDEIDQPIADFTSEMGGRYTIGTNGRSSGYLVLYNSEYELTGHKSHCRTCGQRNYRYVYTPDATAEGVIMAAVIANDGCWTNETYLDQPAIEALRMHPEEKLVLIRRAKTIAKDHTIGNRCGACGTEGEYGRVNYTLPPKRLSVYPGKSIDQNEDFSEWSMSELRNRVELVLRFDQACDEIRDNFIELIGSCKVVEEVVMIPKTVKRIECCHAS